MTATSLPTRQRLHLRVSGVVQGVGFRPYVHRLAGELGLDGQVGNDGNGVFIEVEGPPAAVASFTGRLAAGAPPLARVDRVDTAPVPATGRSGFTIAPSRPGEATRTFVSPDIAVCADCLAELADPADRRYRYPFVNCTNCGPRFTITVRLPYDRPNTTMAGFTMCAACAAEYHDPSDRRFHAQPTACPACGPALSLLGAGGRGVTGTDAALAGAQRVLAAGGIVAVKGLGGYHLACDATSTAAVERLRRRKHRADKPLAVMVADPGAAGRLAVLAGVGGRALASPQRPIVLLPRRPGARLSPAVAPGQATVGLLLPYTPLHHLLFAAVPGGAPGPLPAALVMTSGNLSDEPICYDDAEARERLAEIADAWLTHDRPIHVPCDDSVVRVEGREEIPIRRSRGFAPLPIRLPVDAPPMLAAGGEVKNTFCLAAGTDAWMGQHLGDMGSPASLDALSRSAAQFAGMYRVEPVTVAADAHPGYHTRRGAAALAGPTRPVEEVQHHHAPLAAVMAEHGVAGGTPVIGVIFDGTGYGTDGAVWGGEILTGGYAAVARAAHLRYVPLPGGDAAVRRPYRMALAHLRAAGLAWDGDLPPVRAAAPGELGVLERQLERGVACAPTSSMGRLFDAASSLIGLRHIVTFEAQAAMELEAAAGPLRAAPWHFAVEGGVIDAGPVLSGMIAGLRAGVGQKDLAAAFHAAVAALVADIARRLRRRTGITTVALSGGVWQNAVLLRSARAALERDGFEVLAHRVVPPNDGGLALGQVAVVAARAAAGEVDR